MCESGAVANNVCITPTVKFNSVAVSDYSCTPDSSLSCSYHDSSDNVASIESTLFTVTDTSCRCSSGTNGFCLPRDTSEYKLLHTYWNTGIATMIQGCHKLDEANYFAWTDCKSNNVIY